MAESEDSVLKMVGYGVMISLGTGLLEGLVWGLFAGDVLRGLGIGLCLGAATGVFVGVVVALSGRRRSSD